MKTILLLLAMLSVFGARLSAQDYRAFSTSDGTISVRAALLRVEPDLTGARMAVLRRQGDGAVVRVRVDLLSAEDAKYVKEFEALMSVPATMRGRLTVGSRAELRKANGSSFAAAEAAVEQGLLWLSQKQNPDGSWGTTHLAAMTGLSLLAFAGHGYGPGSDRYGETITKGILRLMAMAAKNPKPFAGVFSETPAIIKSTYEHAIAMQALVELYAFSERGTKAPPGLAEAIIKGEGIIIRNQTPAGAWGYKDGIGYDPYGGNDLCVSGWQIPALSACRDGGFKNDQRSAALKKAMNYLLSKQTADGGFGATERQGYYNQWNLTGSALYGLAGTSQSSAMDWAGRRRGTDWLHNFVKKEPLQWTKECSLHSWYFNSLAMFVAGGEAWTTWNSMCEPLLLTNQNPDGSWKAEGAATLAASSSAAAGKDQDIYRTCLAALILETPCRFIRPAVKK